MPPRMEPQLRPQAALRRPTQPVSQFPLSPTASVSPEGLGPYAVRLRSRWSLEVRWGTEGRPAIHLPVWDPGTRPRAAA